MTGMRVSAIWGGKRGRKSFLPKYWKQKTQKNKKKKTKTKTVLKVNRLPSDEASNLTKSTYNAHARTPRAHLVDRKRTEDTPIADT